MDSEQMVSFVVPGDPKAQGRPRFARYRTKAGKQGILAYDPQDSANFKQKVAFFAREGGVGLYTRPVSLTVKFYARRPKRLMRKKDDSGAIACISRPDLDNYLKAILDGLNGIAWVDDAVVYHAEVSKWYHEKGGNQRTEITII